MIAVRLLLWIIALGFTALMFVGCSPFQTTDRQEREYTWRHQAMVSGPSIYWTCLHGNRIYALQKFSERSSTGLWPGASIAVAAGRCEP